MIFKFVPPKTLLNLEQYMGPGNKRYYRVPSGKGYPSVTTILDASKKEDIAAWRAKVGDVEANRVSNYAKGRGQDLGTALEAYIRGNPIEVLMPDTQQMFVRMKKIIDANLTDVHYMEQTLYSDKLRLAGKPDLIGVWNGKLTVVDFKNSGKPKKREWIDGYFQQTCAYACFYEELLGVPIDDLVILIGVEGQPAQLFEDKTKNIIPGLVGAIKIYYKSLEV